MFSLHLQKTLQMASISNIFVIKRCQSNMWSREVLSHSHIYLSESMWPHSFKLIIT